MIAIKPQTIILTNDEIVLQIADHPQTPFIDVNNCGTRHRITFNHAGDVVSIREMRVEVDNASTGR